MKTGLIILSILLPIVSMGQQFTEKPVEIGELKGTLSEPVKKTKTAILIIAGSGPTDRDGNSALGYNNNSLKMISDGFSNEGYAVLRYDKRGIAKSKAAVIDQKDLRFEHLVEDAGKWLDFLKAQGYTSLIIAGHSQGSLVGMMAAQGRKDVKALISIAGLSEDAGEALVRQLRVQSVEIAEGARVNIDSMKAGYTIKRYNPYLISLFGPAIQPYLKSYIAYTPTEEIKKLKIPILIVNGTTDIQVGVDQAEALLAASANSELLIIEGMNHILKDAPSDATLNMATYNNPDLPLSPELMPGMLKFIKKI